MLLADGVAAPTGALAVAGPFVYVAAALPSVTLGEPTPSWRQTVWRCRNTDCVSAPMDRYRGAARRELLAVAPDGRVLVVRDDRIALLDASPGWVLSDPAGLR